MPRLPIDYSRTVIYRISCNDLPDFIYVGSTTDFVKRKNQHKCYSKTKECKLYQIMRENGGWDNWRICIIEEYPDCKNCIEQRMREQKWIDELNGNLNMKKAYISEEELKEKNKKYLKEYYKENKEQILEEQKEYAEQHKEEIKEYKKEYTEQNREKIKQYRKEYYQKMKNSKSAK
jgi:hypothetical protein